MGIQHFSRVYGFFFFRFKAPADSGPKTVRIFMNQPNTVDFDAADGMGSTQVTINAIIIVSIHYIFMFIIAVFLTVMIIALQDLVLTPGQLEGTEIIPLKFVKFQNVQNLQFFIKVIHQTDQGTPTVTLSNFQDNQSGADVTVIEYISLIGQCHACGSQ